MIQPVNQVAKTVFIKPEKRQELPERKQSFQEQSSFSQKKKRENKNPLILPSTPAVWLDEEVETPLNYQEVIEEYLYLKQEVKSKFDLKI